MSRFECIYVCECVVINSVTPLSSTFREKEKQRRGNKNKLWRYAWTRTLVLLVFIRDISAPVGFDAHGRGGVRGNVFTRYGLDFTNTSLPLPSLVYCLAFYRKNHQQSKRTRNKRRCLNQNLDLISMRAMITQLEVCQDINQAALYTICFQLP